MPNDLTGDFDVVAEFAVPAVNRVLAAMHRVERFPHSIAVRVDDIIPSNPNFDRPPVVGAIDSYGETVSDQDRIGYPVPITGEVAGIASGWLLDSVVNIDPGLVADPTIEPSDLQGRAQLQLSPPTVVIADTSGTNVTVRMGIMARYFPDPGTPPLAEFIRGELTITAPVTRVASQVGSVIEIDIRANTTVVHFTAQWSSSPLSAQDLAGVNLLIRNAVKTGFLPSNSRLPSDVSHIQFKTLTGATSAVAVMLNMSGAAGNRASMTQIFLAAGDDFGFAVGVDYVRAAFQPTIDRILGEPVDPVKFTISTIFYTWHITYTITLNSAAVELHDGKIRLRVNGHAHTGTSWLPDFDFTARLDFTLVADGDTANLVPGDVSLDTSSIIVDQFKGGAVSKMRRVRDRVFADDSANASVRSMLSAEGNLGAFLDSLLTPVRKDAVVEPRLFILSYSSAEIRPSGIVLHGWLSVADWPAPHVEFAIVPSASAGGLGGPATTGILGGPDYSALKSWIPGGTIESFEWKRQGQPGPGSIDSNRFVRLDPGPSVVSDADLPNFVSASPPLCLTVRGTRISSSGPVVQEQVSAAVCGYSIPGLGGVWEDVEPLVALAGPGPDGNVRTHGHAAATSARETGGAPNMIVHFSAEGSAFDAAASSRALRESGRTDAAVAMLNVVDPGQLARTPYSDGLTYAEDHEGQWSRRFGVSTSERPLTLIVSPFGKVMWKQQGRIDPASLASALRSNLERSSPRRAPMRSATLRIGHRPPNFLFEHATGRKLTLRKLAGRPVTLVFLRNDSEPSMTALNDLEASNSDAARSLVLAVHADDARERGQTSDRDPSPVVHIDDRSRRIARAWGISMWPTIISIDSLGAVRSIQYGRQDTEDAHARGSSQ